MARKVRAAQPPVAKKLRAWRYRRGPNTWESISVKEFDLANRIKIIPGRMRPARGELTATAMMARKMYVITYRKDHPKDWFRFS
jgi:hypothetical protein